MTQTPDEPTDPADGGTGGSEPGAGRKLDEDALEFSGYAVDGVNDPAPGPVQELGVWSLAEDGDWAGIFLTDLDGSGHSKLAGGEGDFSSLLWDNDGETLVAIFTSRGRSDLVRIRLDGTVETMGEGGTWDSPVTTSLGPIATYEAIWKGTGLQWLFPWTTGEDRTIAAKNGRFEDQFEPYQVHLYRIESSKP